MTSTVRCHRGTISGPFFFVLPSYDTLLPQPLVFRTGTRPEIPSGQHYLGPTLLILLGSTLLEKRLAANTTRGLSSPRRYAARNPIGQSYSGPTLLEIGRWPTATRGSFPVAGTLRESCRRRQTATSRCLPSTTSASGAACRCCHSISPSAARQLFMTRSTAAAIYGPLNGHGDAVMILPPFF